MTPILRASVVAFLVLATCISHGQDTRVRTVPTDSLPDQTAVLPLEVVPGETAVFSEGQKSSPSPLSDGVGCGERRVWTPVYGDLSTTNKVINRAKSKKMLQTSPS